MSKRKIIIVGTAYPYRGGLAAFNERLAREYLHQDNDVQIFTFTLQYPKFLFPGKSQYSIENPPADLHIHRKINSINPFNWIKIGREIKKLNADIMITKFWLPFMAPCFGTIERIVRKNNKTKVISILDNVIPHEKRIADKLFVRYFVNSTQGFVAMSKSVLNDLGLFDKEKPRILCPHPLYDNFGLKLNREEALNMLELDTSFRYILFFGIIRAYKGLDLLIEAFYRLRKSNDNVKLIIAGEFYEDKEQYKSLIKKYNLEEDIILRDEFIPDSKVNIYFSACDIVAQPYKSATQSGVTQIAYHFEKSMLVTDVGGLSEIVPDKKVGYVVNTDPDEIAQALDDFFKNNRQQEFEKNILIEKEKYSWENMVNAIDSLL
ncbi:MAG: glycosyltransferase [Bacteroidales bacterium]|jgi:glycosyltransferase involved in cell wall biosynthesis|nr:glycosyltransferase [Bacteroidales bacterium]